MEQQIRLLCITLNIPCPADATPFTPELIASVKSHDEVEAIRIVRAHFKTLVLVQAKRLVDFLKLEDAPQA